MSSYTPLITIYTRVYNTEKYIRKCVESVLNQTYTNIEYLILDNGSTDGCTSILQEYAQKDSRIHLHRSETNQRFTLHEFVNQHSHGEYIMILDSDDWLDPNCLSESLNFLLNNHLDIAMFGSVFHLEETNSTALRVAPYDLIISAQDYARFFTSMHVFCRACWAKLFQKSIFLSLSANEAEFFEHMIRSNFRYGTDTLWVFRCLRVAKKVGILAQPLHHYIVRKRSDSYIYESNRFASDIALFQDALDFLQGYGPVSLQNLTFLYIVYCNAVNDTLNVIEKSQLSPKEKLEEYKKIALEPITQGAYRVSDESATNSKGFLFLYMLKNASLVENSQDYLESLSFYLPHCSKVLAIADADLLGQNDAFFQPLLKDDASLLRDNLLQEFKKSPYRSQEKIVNLLSALTDELPVCKTATTHRFINHFFKIYGYLLHSQHLEALEEMTDLLLNHRVKDAQEVFFQVYLTLAALLQQEPAYLFGKIQMAEYLFSAKHYQEAAQIVAELEKMGLSEHDDVVKLKKKLARYLPA